MAFPVGIYYQKENTSAFGVRMSLADTMKAGEDAAEEEEGNCLVEEKYGVDE